MSAATAELKIVWKICDAEIKTYANCILSKEVDRKKLRNTIIKLME